MRGPGTILGFLFLAALPMLARAQPVGDEFQVNTYTTGNQSTAFGRPLVASDASGNVVFVWRSAGQDGSSAGIFGQRYDSEGTALGTEFRVNSYTTNSQSEPCVASDPSGNVVVVWNSEGQDGDERGVFGQRYDSSGVPRGAEFRVNSYTTSYQQNAVVASDASGNFVVVWDSDGQDGSDEGIFGQRYDSAGQALGIEFRVNSYATSTQKNPAVASDATGNFVVVWEDRTQDGGGYGVFGQRYDSAGGTLGSEFRVNSFTASSQRHASVASDATGNFVVVWDSIYQDGSAYGVFGQRYDSAGVPQGDEFQVNSWTTGNQDDPSISSDSNGNFVVVWNGLYQEGDSFAVFGQRYDNAGVAQGEEFQINRADDGTFEELISAAAPSDSTRGSFGWTVTGPPSGTARVRIAWTDDLSVSDASDVTFQIRPVGAAGGATPLP